MRFVSPLGGVFWFAAGGFSEATNEGRMDGLLKSVREIGEFVKANSLRNGAIDFNPNAKVFRCRIDDGSIGPIAYITGRGSSLESAIVEAANGLKLHVAKQSQAS